MHCDGIRYGSYLMAIERTRIIGMEHALRQFRRAPDVARKHIGNAVRVTEITLAGKVRREYQTFSDTGALAQSVGSKTTGLRAHITIEEGEIFGRRPSVYWRFVEFGSIHNKPARPVIRSNSETEEAPMIGRVKLAAVLMERELTI